MVFDASRCIKISGKCPVSSHRVTGPYVAYEFKKCRCRPVDYRNVMGVQHRIVWQGLVSRIDDIRIGNAYCEFEKYSYIYI